MGTAVRPRERGGCTAAEPVTGPEASDRFGWLWTALFAFTLGVPTVIALTRRRTCRVAHKLAVVGGRGRRAALHWLVMARHPEWWEHRLGPLAVYWAAGLRADGACWPACTAASRSCCTGCTH